MENGSIEVATADRKAVIRVRGRGDFINGQPLRRFLYAMIERGVTDFLVDLGECRTMDSTFMGILTGAALTLRRMHDRRIVLAHIDERNRRALATIGIHVLFDMLPKSALGTPSDRGAAYEPLSGPTPSGRELVASMLEAHRSLVEASGDSAGEFRDVCELLSEELAEGGATPPPEAAAPTSR